MLTPIMTEKGAGINIKTHAISLKIQLNEAYSTIACRCGFLAWPARLTDV